MIKLIASIMITLVLFSPAPIEAYNLTAPVDLYELYLNESNVSFIYNYYNSTVGNGSGNGTTNHANLTNLDWYFSGHTNVTFVTNSTMDRNLSNYSNNPGFLTNTGFEYNLSDGGGTSVRQNPNMTSNTLPYGTVNNSPVFASYFGWTAFDGVYPDATGFVTTTPSYSWIIYQFVSPIRIENYSIANRNEGAQPRSPKSWTLQGSSNNISYTILDSQSNIVDWATTSNIKHNYNVTTPGTYSYYKLNITESNDATYMGIGEISFNITSKYNSGFELIDKNNGLWCVKIHTNGTLYTTSGECL